MTIRASLLLAAVAVGTQGFADKPTMIVADDFGAYFRGADSAMTKEGLEQYADALTAGGQVTHVFWCPVAGRANFDAKATEPIWKGLGDPATTFAQKRDSQAVADGNRRWAENAKKLADAGIDPYRVWIDRTRAKGVSPWISIRLTDTQYASDPAYFRTPSVLAQHPDWLLKNGGHGGGAADYAHDELRDWFKKIVAETVARYKDVDGVEIDCISGNNYWTFLPHDMPNGRPKREMFNGFVTELRQVAREASGKKDLPLALRIVSDTNLFVPNFMDGNLPADILIPCGDTPTLLRDWQRFSRTTSAHIMPAFVCRGSLPQVAGQLGRVRGCGFPGVMLKDVHVSAPDVRAALAAGKLGGPTGPREIVLGPEQHMLEWKRAAWGYVDCRTTFPWKLDWTYEGEFALEQGSVAETSVTVVLNGNFRTASPKTVILNGWQPTGVTTKGNILVYAFPKESVVEGVNQIVIPAVQPAGTPVKEMASVNQITVKIDR